MKKLKKIMSMFLVILVSTLFIGCKSSLSKNKDGNSINIIVESQDTSDKEALGSLLLDFKEKYKDYNININENKNIDEIKKNIKEKKCDVIICSRTSFLELHKVGLINELTSYFENSKLQQDFYNIIAAYGKIKDKFYGMALLPYSLQFAYNEKLVKELAGDNDINDFDNLLEILNIKNVKIPVILPKELSEERALATLIGNSIIKEDNLVDIYDGEKEVHNNISIINETLDKLNNLKKEKMINFNMFYKASLEEINSLQDGKCPIALVTSLIGVGNKDYGNISFLGEINKDMVNTTPPVFTNYIVATCNNNINTISVNKFLDYLLDNKSYMNIANKGYLTGNKVVDSSCKGINKKYVWTIANASLANIPYYLNLPNTFINTLDDLIKNAMEGYYNKDDTMKKLKEIK